MPGEWDWMRRLGGFGGLGGGMRTPGITPMPGIIAPPPPSPSGLFGSDPEQRQNVMLAMASQLLQGSGPSPVRKSFAQLVGDTLMAGQQAKHQTQAYQDQRTSDALRRELLQEQLDEARNRRELEAGRSGDWGRSAPRPPAIGVPQDGIGPVPGDSYRTPTLEGRAQIAAQSALERGDYAGANQAAQLGAAFSREPNMTDDLREYRVAQAQGYPGGFFDYQRELRKASASPGTTVSVNTDKTFGATLAEQQAKQYSSLYESAQAAPEAIARAERVRKVLAQGAFTGTGAEFQLAAGKAFRAAGWDFGGSDIENTEALSAELARSTLDSIKSSGLAGSQGITNSEREFLERAVAGRITLEGGTIRRLSDLNERVARNTLKRWNETAGRLDPGLLRQLGMTTIDQPGPTSGGPLSGTLIPNADGTYNYSPGR